MENATQMRPNSWAKVQVFLQNTLSYLINYFYYKITCTNFRKFKVYFKKAKGRK